LSLAIMGYGGFPDAGHTLVIRAQREVSLLFALIGALIVLGLVSYYGISALANAGEPTPESVVQEFRDQGLEVGEAYPIEQDEGFKESPTPKVYESGVRFLVPSVCPEECGGRVYSFEDEEDLETMEEYYDSLDNLTMFGPNFGGYTYRNGLLLLQIGGDMKKNRADEYGRVFQDM
jgi:hypothetical protein